MTQLYEVEDRELGLFKMEGALDGLTLNLKV